jgi:hypothetical protein
MTRATSPVLNCASTAACGKSEERPNAVPDLDQVGYSNTRFMVGSKSRPEASKHCMRPGLDVQILCRSPNLEI